MPPRNYDRPAYATQIAVLVGRRIGHARKDRGLTQEQLADILDVPAASLLPGDDAKHPNALSIMTLTEQASAVTDELHALVELVNKQQRAAP